MNGPTGDLDHPEGWRPPNYLSRPLLPEHVVCDRCGAVVGDQEFHTRFHVAIATTLAATARNVDLIYQRQEQGKQADP